MNKERILELARRIREDDRPVVPNMAGKLLGFKMETYFTADAICRTAGCIAGWAKAIYEPESWLKYTEYTMGGIWEVDGARILDLDIDTAINLFNSSNILLRLVTPEIAAGVLEHLAATGEVVFPDAVYKDDLDLDSIG